MIMKRIMILLTMLVAACTSPSYPGVDRPNSGGNSSVDREVIDYIDQRLEAEYYWLDEVAKKCNSFDRGVAWEDYLGNVLLRLTTNTDDGYLTSKGQRVLYSYIRELPASTRTETVGFGIDLHTTIVIIDKENSYYGFVVDNVFEGSPAMEGGVRRGDVIVKVDNNYITPNNYLTLFNSIYQNKLSNIRLQVRRQYTPEGDQESYAVELTAAAYKECTVAHSEIIEGVKRVGYLVYTGFDTSSDIELVEALAHFASEGITEVVLDLRINSGGSLSSALKLTSTLLPASYEGSVLCEARRNPKNKRAETSELFKLQAMEFNLGIDHLTVIVSDNSASASELVIMGLRGLDIPVTLVGSTTQGKNCGMDVTRRTIGSLYLEYAPITFMCLDAKGFGDWGDGIGVDIEVVEYDKLYPIPYVPWGSSYAAQDAALRCALESIGYDFEDATRGDATEREAWDAATTLVEPIEGIRLYE